MANLELELYTDDPREAAALRAYWTLAEDGETWARTVTAVREEYGFRQREMQALVQEGGIARLFDVRCPECGNPQEATSRTHYADLRRRGDVLCTACRVLAEQTRQEAARERQERRQQALREAFPIHTDLELQAGDLTLFQAVALHALFSDPAVENTGLTTPTALWPKERRWAPETLRDDHERRLLRAESRTLIRPHRDSDADAFLWEDDQPTGSFYLGQAGYYLVGAETDPAARVPRLLTGLNRVFREGPWPDAWLRQWRDLWEELAIAQAGAYLDMKLREHHLEMRQGGGTRTALADALATFSLGQVFNFIYRAAKDSAAYYQRGGVNTAQAANSTIGRISASADRARANGWEVKSFGMPWNLPFSAIAETFFSKVMWQADMMQVALPAAQVPAHAWAGEEPEAAREAAVELPGPTVELPGPVVDFPGPRATTDYLRQFGSGRADEPVRYALVTPDGEITFGDAPLRDIPAAFEGGGDGETGTEYLRSLYPVAVYFHVPYYDDTRRMNKVANGMYWELSAPVQGEDDGEDDDPEDRKIKLRGPVAFVDRHNRGLSAEQESVITGAHRTAVARLRARGWL
ncbi:hypothetical protein [Streptomyces virginiae]|uniref:hypothetical protein n=2 Tax=Streptomyces virginiae TaxID=1961 RepID=UPI002DB67890|nr:hypothetical protein [Streptomyces sp. CMAA1738]MEC4572596.1 hypothetical protein [Streptomyces sp. CMAA1738]